LDELATTSLISLDPTVHTVGSEAGEKLATSEFEFPAATPTKIPLATSDATAEFKAAEKPPPMDRLAYTPFGHTREAESVATKLTDWMICEMVPAPLSPRALTA
jgi:hypothetical protein